MEDISDIRDVAKLANVSIGTVSNAFKRPEKVAPETAARIFEAAKQLHYFPNRLASALVTSKTHLLGLMVSYSGSGLRGMAVNEFVEAATKYGYMVIVVSTNLNVEEERQIVNRFIQYRVDGVVLYSDFIEGYTEHIRILERNGIPCVVIKRYDEAYENITVKADRALTDVANQLKQYGHRHVAVVTLNTNMADGKPSVRCYRLETLRKKLESVGLSLYDNDIVSVEEESMNVGGKVVDDWLDSGRKLPTVFFCLNDSLALGMIQRFQKRGYSVPRQVSVIGYGNFESSISSTPSLSTVDVREIELLKLAYTMMMERIDNPELPRRDVEVEHKFILRDSLGPCREDEDVTDMFL